MTPEPAKIYVRFIGDARGYLLRPADVPAADEVPSGWVTAKIGTTDKEVRINLDQAYLVEPADCPDYR